MCKTNNDCGREENCKFGGCFCKDWGRKNFFDDYFERCLQNAEVFILYIGKYIHMYMYWSFHLYTAIYIGNCG